MIVFSGVAAGGFRDASFAIKPGRTTRILTLSDADTDLLLRLLLGAERPDAGEVLLFGESLGKVTEERALALLARIGFVWRGGGFVSNLKVWENILLPLWYRGDLQAAKREARVVELLDRLGMEPERVPHFLQSLPGNLGTRDRRFLGLVRAMLQEPAVMVYVDVSEGLDGSTRDRIIALAQWYHALQEGRASVYVTDNEPSLAGAPADVVIRQGKDGRIGP